MELEEEEDIVGPALAMPATRGYQQEMLEESLQKNIIIALDTGSGKTHIAVLRLKHEMEREPTKVHIIHIIIC
jgi:endoribonuclease Dicer